MTEVMCQNSFSLVKKSKRSNQIKCLCACDQEKYQKFTQRKKGKLHFSPFNYWVISIPPFIYKIEQCPPLYIENMQIAPHHLILC
jgi:hypothetical protein